MKGNTLVLVQNNNFSEKLSQTTQSASSPCKFSKPIPLQTLNYLKNLKGNRLIIPKEISLEERLSIYFREYNLLYEENKRLNRQFIEVIEEKNELTQIFIAKKKLNQASGGSVKRKRRYAFQIRREFTCPMDECGKCYGTEGSLTQHVKLKHGEYFESGEYDVYISEIIKGKQTLETSSV